MSVRYPDSSPITASGNIRTAASPCSDNEHRSAEAKNAQRSSDWFSIYCAAMLERDRDRALPQIERAQQAIRNRAAQLREGPANHDREVRDLSKALNHLGILLHHAAKDSGRSLWD